MLTGYPYLGESEIGFMVREAGLVLPVVMGWWVTGWGAVRGNPERCKKPWIEEAK